MAPREPSLILLFASIVAIFLVGCSPQTVSDFLAGRVSDCLDEDGCGPDSSGTPLNQWRPPGISVNARFGDDEELPHLSLLLIAREWTPFCPKIPSTIAANIDGLDLPRSDWDVVFGCPEVLWELRREEWPTEQAETSTVEVRDNETTFVLSVPFSLTRPPTLVLEESILDPGGPIEIRDEPSTPGLQLDSIELRSPDEKPLVIDPQYDQDGAHFTMPSEVVAGPATLTVTAGIYSDVDCDGAEFCEAYVQSVHRFEVEVSDQR